MLTFLGDLYCPDPFPVTGMPEGTVVINLEAPVSASGEPWPGKINLKTDACHLRALFGDRPIVACLANNHIMDYGAEGLGDTLEALAALGIPCFGAGTPEDRCRNPLIVDAGGVPVALLGYVCASTKAVMATEEHPGVAPIQLEAVRRDLAAATEAGASRRVVVLHWGAEQVGLPRPEDVAVAHALVDAGADLVIGHHAHRTQPIERYRDRLICYGLGNAAFQGGSRRRGNRRSLVVRWDPRGGEAQVHVAEYTGAALRVGPGRRVRHAASLSNTRLYRARFRLSFVAGKARFAASGFLAQPKWPRLEHLRSLFRWATTKEID